LRERGVEFDAIDYVKQPLERAELDELIELIENPPCDLIRKDKAFEDLGLNASHYAEDVTADAVAALLLVHPKLMQRPIAVQGKRALIARPSDRVLEMDLGTS
jgi:arsenate reductase